MGHRELRAPASGNARQTRKIAGLLAVLAILTALLVQFISELALS